MNKQPTRRRRAARTVAVGVAVAALVALLGAGQALATLAPPDERVLERQGRIDHQKSAGQAGEQGKPEEPSQGSPAGTPRQAIRPEPPPTGPPPPLGDGQVAPGPTTAAPAGGRGGLVVIAVLAALLLAVGAATTWRVRHRRPQPGSTA